MPDHRGKLIVVSGPSGAGKSTVISRVMQRRHDLCFSVSATTRDPRPGEVNGVDYFFVTWDEFDRMIGDDELLEHAEYNRDNYGTPRAYVEEKRRALEQRLRGRGTDPEERIHSRLMRARGEYREADFYDYIVVNDDPEVAAAELDSIITAELCRYSERRHYLIPEESPFLNF